MSKKKRKEIRRYPMGIRVNAGGKSLPMASMVYEILYDDFSTKTQRGQSVYALYRGESTPPGTCRPDLYAQIQAAAILLQEIEHACLLVDGQLTGPDGKVAKP